MEIRSRVVPGLLVTGLVLGGGGAVLAAAGGSSSHRSSAKEQYCDPHERSDCNTPNGGNPGGPSENSKKKKKKHAKISVRKYPRLRCYSGPLRFRIKVAHKRSRARTRVYIDGRWVGSTKKRSLTVRNRVER